MNQQEVKPARWDPVEPIRRALIPFLSPSETIRRIAVFSNLPQWMGCVFTSFFLVWFRRTWYVATTDQNVYFAKWGFGKIDSKSVLRIPRKDVQLKGNDLIFVVPNESKPRKLYSVLLGGDSRFKEDLLNPGNFTVNQSGSLIQEVAGVPQPVSQPDQTSQKTCPKCAEKNQLEALVCRYCGYQFNEADVKAAKAAQQQAEEQAKIAQQAAQEKASQAQKEAKEKGRRNRNLVLTIFGGLLGGAGLLIGLLLTIIQLTSTTAANNVTGFVGIMVICPLPLIVIGGVLLIIGILALRRR